MTQIFDIEKAEDLFGVLENEFRSYCGHSAKSAEDILLILMLTNHLREWIAPGYKRKKDRWPAPKTPEQTFSKDIFEHPNFAIIRDLCNGTKHAIKKDLGTTTKYEENMHAWSDLHKVRDMHKGQAISYLVDGEPIERIIEPVVAKYREWFSGTTKENPRARPLRPS
jgi:hypothetical protein